jgi:tetratricopeptide (TPR) repeat protein/tRNA A-37 threonylcarbamoyl transferase component Bud32/TolB-like protein
MIGQTLGHYLIVEKIGAGGMGEVYRAHDQRLDRDVALKILQAGTLSDEAARRQFRKEALALAKLNHPNIETVHEFSTQDDVDFLVMELIAGSVLSDKLKQGPLPEKEIVRLGTQLAEGLAAAHEHRVIHRDLKPGNLMITPDGRLKILDFGLARLLQLPQEVDLTVSVTTKTGTVSGTVPYMSPEQLRGLPVDERSDIYAAGALLYEMATGHRPFPQSQSAELVGAILHQTPDPPSSRNQRLTPILESVIMKALEKDPAERYQSARELKVVLEGVAAGQSAKVLPRSRVLFVTVGVSVMTVLLVGLGLGLNLGGLGDRFLHRGAARPAVVSSAPVKARRSVAVLGFKNVSERQDEAWLSTALAEMLTTELAAGEQLRAIPGENVARMKINLSLPETDSFGQDTLERIRKNLNADEIVLGSYVPLGGGQIRVDLRLQDTRAGEILAVASVKGNEDQVDDLVGRAGTILRDKLGVGEVSPAQALAVRATLPRNGDAARFYSEGLQKLRQYDYLRARDVLQKAVEVEPQYALAHSALAVAWKGLGYDANAKEEAKKAFDLSANFSREDRLWIEGQYRELTNDGAKAVETYRTLFDFFPDNLDYGLRLAAAQTSASKGKDALATLASLRKFPAPASEDARIDLYDAVAAASLGDYKRQQASAAKAVATADSQGARLLAAQARISECSALRYVGNPQEAISVCKDAQKIFESAGDRGNAAHALNSIAVVLMEQGDAAGARRAYEESLATTKEIGDKKSHAMALNNLAGVLRDQLDLPGSRRLLAEAMADFREIGEKGGVVRCLENTGIILVDEGKLDEARKKQEEALAIAQEMGNKSLTAYALYLLGEVYADQGNLAAALKSDEQSLEIRKGLGEPRMIGETQLALADLATKEKQFPGAESTARESAQQLEKLNDVDDAAFAYYLLARALAAQGKTTDAHAAIDKASALTQKGGDTNIRLRVAVEAGIIGASSGSPADVSEAKKSIQSVLTDATKQNLTGIQLEARLGMGEVEMKSGDRSTGRAHLAALQKDATAKGFLLIAREAAAAGK